MECLLFHPDYALFLSQDERVEYRLTEKEVSPIAKKVTAIMFKARAPAIICRLPCSTPPTAEESSMDYCPSLRPLSAMKPHRFQSPP
ncbi:unnamed protein product [Heligmosomoides polygyrus]|uniref:HGTP_anticodon2 domain-containing protein n=1 Tax=Heligmosomoides polygyrus TaxID=6339 RepID=A0A183FF56_HELPZ|nr:unnamed protein product [Heligmosomoides polygyrus]